MNTIVILFLTFFPTRFINIECHVSNIFIFELPTVVLLKLANTLKELEIVYDANVDLVRLPSDYNNYENNEDGTADNETFRSIWHTSRLTFDAFKSLNTVLSTCHQLEYIRYVNPHYYDISSSSRSAIFTNKDDEALCLSLKHLELAFAGIENVDHILKRCPNLQILRLEALAHTVRAPVLDSIQRYCPRLQYLSFNYHHDLLYGKRLYDHYYAKSSIFNNRNIATITQNSQPQSSQQSSSSSSSSLTQLNISIRDMDYVIPLINRHADTIEQMSLSDEPIYDPQLLSVRQMDRLVSLIVNRVRYPQALATLIPKLPSLRNLEFYNTRMTGNTFISALKNVNTLEKLTIHGKISADMREITSLFHAYAEASMVPTVNEQGEKTTSDCTTGPNGRQKLAHVSLIECTFLENRVLEALANIKTLSSVTIENATGMSGNGIDSFCEQLNWLPELTSITLSGLACVDDTTLSILASSPRRRRAESRDVVKTITLKSLPNVTKRGLDRLSKKQGVSLTSYNCGGGRF